MAGGEAARGVPRRSAAQHFKAEQAALKALGINLADGHLEGYVYKPDRFKADDRELKKPWEESVEEQLIKLLGPLQPIVSEKPESWSNEECLFEVREGVAYVTMNRPAANNAMNDGLSAGLIDAARILKGRSDIRIAVLTGNGRMFCAGGDPKSFQAAQASAGVVATGEEEEEEIVTAEPGAILGYSTELEPSKVGADKYAASLARVFFEWATLPQFTIALLNGSAMGGGVGLTCCCDMAIGVKAGHVTLSEVKLGVIPAVISPHVIRTIGAANAKRLFVTAENITMEQAKALGMVQRVVKDPSEFPAAVQEVAQKLQSCAPGAVGAAKKCILNCLNQPMSDSLLQYTAKEYVRTRKSDECEEGMRAVAARSRPNWFTSPIAVKQA